MNLQQLGIDILKSIGLFAGLVTVTWILTSFCSWMDKKRKEYNAKHPLKPFVREDFNDF